MVTLATFPQLPADYVEQIDAILACPGSNAATLTQTVGALEQVWQSIVALTGEIYQPKFQI
jgi:hypothetical protein